MSPPRVLLTGAAGGVGSALWPRLHREFALRLFDLAPVADVPDDVETRVGDIADAPAMVEAMQDVDAVVHLAGHRFATASWDELVRPNLVGTHTVLSVAGELNVPRVVFASSCHASGRYDVDRAVGVDPVWPPRPCCAYGVSKVYGEVAGRMIAERSRTSIACLRLGAVSERPHGRLGLAFWLSLPDLALAVTSALRSEVDYGVYYVASANARERWNLEPAKRDLGFVPVDDAARHRADVDMAVPVPVCYRDAV